MRILNPDTISIGYLLPTRDAVAQGQHAATPLIALGERAEMLGFDVIWLGDGPLARGRHDALSMIAALAARTERAFLGTGVLIAALRSPLLLAQAAATVDQIAQGRLLLGIGAGFPFPETEREFEAVGVPYADRVGRMTETITAMRALWANPGEPVHYEGRHITLDRVALAPAPHRRGGPPIWLAGAGEAAERRVGDIGEGWLPYPPTAELYAQGWKRVRAAAVQEGRERPPLAGLYATVALDACTETAQQRLRRHIERYYRQPLELISMLQATYAGTPEGLTAWLTPYVQAGARHIVLRISDEDSARGLEIAGEARAALRRELVDAARA